MPYCERCGDGMLKPHVTFFGGSVPQEDVQAAADAVAAADALLVVGSSLQVLGLGLGIGLGIGIGIGIGIGLGIGRGIGRPTRGGLAAGVLGLPPRPRRAPGEHLYLPHISPVSPLHLARAAHQAGAPIAILI